MHKTNLRPFCKSGSDRLSLYIDAVSAHCIGPMTFRKCIHGNNNNKQQQQQELLQNIVCIIAPVCLVSVLLWRVEGVRYYLLRKGEKVQKGFHIIFSQSTLTEGKKATCQLG